MVLGAVAWGIFGRLPQTVTASGMITRPQGAADVQSLYAGMVTKIGTSVGGQVSAGQVLAVIPDATGAAHDVVSPYAGQVLSVGVSSGQVIGTGSEVASIERGAAGGPLVALLFVPSQSAAGIVPGEQVKLAVSTAPASAFGLLRGQVTAVSQFPLTGAEVKALLGGSATVAAIGAGPAPRMITVRLLRNIHTRSGYSWTTAAGPPTARRPRYQHRRSSSLAGTHLAAVGR